MQVFFVLCILLLSCFVGEGWPQQMNATDLQTGCFVFSHPYSHIQRTGLNQTSHSQQTLVIITRQEEPSSPFHFLLCALHCLEIITCLQSCILYHSYLSFRKTSTQTILSLSRCFRQKRGGRTSVYVPIFIYQL